MHFTPVLVFFLAMAVHLAACSTPEPDPVDPDGGPRIMETRTARLVDLEGQVMVKLSGEPDWLPARPEMELATNDKVRTQRDSFAILEFEAGGTLRLEPESLVAVTDLRIEARTQVRRSTFTLMEGRVEAELDSLDEKGSEFKIKTPSAQASVIRREVAFQ